MSYNKGYYILNEEIKMPIVDISITHGAWSVSARIDGPIKALPHDWYRVTIVGEDDIPLVVTSMKMGWDEVRAGDSVTVVQRIDAVFKEGV